MPNRRRSRGSDAEIARRTLGSLVRLIAVIAGLALVALEGAACGAHLFRPYEYEEEMYLSLDGSATVNVNASVAALNALRGASFDQSPEAHVDRDAIRRYFTTPATRVVSVRTSRRSGRWFVHARLDVADVRRLNAAKPFAWSDYRFEREGDEFVFEQTLGAAAGRDVGNVGWNGREIVAIRVHLPSRINAPREGIGRGNILTREESLRDRLAGRPLRLEARIETQSILHRTLWLFGATFFAVATLFTAVIWWVIRGGKAAQHAV